MSGDGFYTTMAHALWGGFEHPGRRNAIVEAMRRLERLLPGGKAWAAASDAEVAGVLESVTGQQRVHRWYLRCGLEASFGDAAQRWPTLVTKVGAHCPRVRGRIALPESYAGLLAALAKRGFRETKARAHATCLYDIERRHLRGAAWLDASDDDVRRALALRRAECKPKSFVQIVNSVRRCLELMHPQPRQRWPAAFEPVHVSTAGPRVQRNVPADVRLPLGVSGFRTNQHTVRKELATLRPASALSPAELAAAINANRPDARLPPAFSDPANRFVPAPIRAFAALRWTDGPRVMAMLRAMAAVAQDLADHQLDYAASITTMFYRLCARLYPHGALLARLRRLSRHRLLRKINRRRLGLHCGLMARGLSHFCHGGMFRDVLNWGAWRPIRAADVGYATRKRRRRHYSFAPEEIQTLLAYCKDRPRDHAMLRFFVHTGCRSRAARLLLVEDVWDADAQQCPAMGCALEKSGVMRHFAIDAVLAEAFRAHILAERPARFMFPNPRDRSLPLEKNAVFTWLKRLCTDAGVHGDHVHPHALRHTVVTMLKSSGNDIMDICSWIGHQQVATTAGYLDHTRSALHKTIVAPWLNAEPQRPQPPRERKRKRSTVDAARAHAARALRYIFDRVLTRADRARVQECIDEKSPQLLLSLGTTNIETPE